jgi:Putative zinc-finger
MDERACARWRGEIGAYIVGALDRQACREVTRHLAACSACRAEYEELVPVRDWLGLLALPADQPVRPLPDSLWKGPLQATRSGDVLVPASRQGSGNHFPARPTAKRRANRTRTRRRRSAAGAVLAAAAAAAIAVPLLSNSGAPAPTYRAVDTATGVSGHAQLHDTPTGTQVDLTASGLPGNEGCILVAVTHGGSDVAGSWGPTYAGGARVVGTTAFPANQLVALRIETDTGTLLLSIRV